MSAQDPNDTEIGRLAGFAQPSGGQEGIERTKQRLTQEKGPTTAASTSKWIDWSESSRFLGSSFDATRIPLNKLEQMRRDPMIAFGLMFIKVFLARAPWYIKSTDAQRASFIDGALRRIYGRFVLQYSGCLDFGYQGLVKNFERGSADWTYIDPNDASGAEIPVWKSNVQPLLWKPFTALHPRRVTPHFIDGSFAGIWLKPYMTNVFTTATGSGQPDVPLDWAMWCTNEKDSVFGSLYGYPRTGYAYRYWWAYWYRFGLADRAFEKWADPPLVVYHPTDIASDGAGGLRNYTQEALTLAEKLRSGANVSVPSDAVVGLDDRTTGMRQWELKPMEVNVQFDALNEAFSYLDVAKLRAMMVPEQAFLEGKGGTSSRNVASTLGDVFEESQAVIKAEIDDHINRYLIPQLLEANFGPGGPTCEIVTTGFDAQDVETARSIIQALAQNAPSRMGALDIRKMFERLGLPLLSAKASEEQADKIAEEAARQGPARVPARAGNAGVNSAGLYYEEDGERIELTVDEQGFVKRLFNKLRREKNEPEAEAEATE